MTMGWMETIHFIGLDLEVATVLAVGSLDAAARALKFAWGRIPSGARSLGSIRVRARRLYTSPRMHPAGNERTLEHWQGLGTGGGENEQGRACRAAAKHDAKAWWRADAALRLARSLITP